MKIDKIQPYFTEQNKIALAEYDQAFDRIHEEAEAALAARDAAKNAEETGELFEKYLNLVNQEAAILKAKETIYGEAEQRYIESFNGDIDAIISDAREIIDAVEKDEYLAYQRQRTEYVNASIDAGKQLNKATRDMARKGYVNCYYYILRVVRVQLNALAFYEGENAVDRVAKMAEDKAASFYKKPKSAKVEARLPKDATIATLRPSAEISGGLLSIPSGPAIHLVYELLRGGNIVERAKQKQKYNRNNKISIGYTGGVPQITSATKAATITLQLDDINQIPEKGSKINKILSRILIQANEQALRNGVLYREAISFPLRDLVGEGQYKNIETARQGFYNAAVTLSSLKVAGKVERGKNKTLQQAAIVPLFKGIAVNQGTCVVYLNELLNWRFIAPFYSLLPDYYFELPDKAAVLLEFIFFLARQHTREIEQKGCFSISYRAIQGYLNLPDEGKTKNPKRDIKDVIEAAIEDIEVRYNKYAGMRPANTDPDFSLLPIGDPTAPIQTYLDEGRLQIGLRGAYAKRFIDISRKTAQEIQAEERRKERIEARARSKKK